MRKIVCVLAGMLCCLLGSISARADVIWEPEDSFYWKHAEECTYVSRMYTTNGPDNKVISYKSPELPQEVDTWENGVPVQILYTYEDSQGNLWGIYDDYQGTTGWIPMAYMELVYDSIAFREEHKSQIIGDVGELDEKYVGETVYLWKYPGSEEYTSIEVSNYTPEYRSIYVEESGRRWGCVQYYFGIRDVWMCLDEPTADFEQIFPEGVADRATTGREAEDMVPEEQGEKVPEGQETESRQEESRQTAEEEKQNFDFGSTERIVPKPNRNLVVTVSILVILVVAVTAVLLIKLKGGRK